LFTEEWGTASPEGEERGEEKIADKVPRRLKEGRLSLWGGKRDPSSWAGNREKKGRT